jgi:hypothetical protein
MNIGIRDTYHQERNNNNVFFSSVHEKRFTHSELVNPVVPAGQVHRYLKFFVNKSIFNPDTDHAKNRRQEVLKSWPSPKEGQAIDQQLWIAIELGCCSLPTVQYKWRREKKPI